MALSLGLTLVAAPAEDPMVAMVRATAYARVEKAQAISADRDLVRFTAAKNAAGETQGQIAERDREWQAGRGKLRKTLASSPCADRLRERIEDDSLIVEAILMDDQGALVCVSAPTSDYWQGDEPKWQRTFEEGQEFFVDEPAFDDSSESYAIQLSVPVRGEEGPIGALTLTLRVSAAGTPAGEDGTR
jgi:hypothetical protein